jgi:hypothetical protein
MLPNKQLPSHKIDDSWHGNSLATSIVIFACSTVLELSYFVSRQVTPESRTRSFETSNSPLASRGYGESVTASMVFNVMRDTIAFVHVLIGATTSLTRGSAPSSDLFGSKCPIRTREVDKLGSREKGHSQILPALISHRITYSHIISIRIRLGVFGKEVGAVA